MQALLELAQNTFAPSSILVKASRRPLKHLFDAYRKRPRKGVAI